MPLVNLYARALETRRPDALFHDPAAEAVLDALRWDPTRFAADWTTQAAIAVRTKLLDGLVGDFMARHRGTFVVNIGAGLCTRFWRLDDGHVRWCELDLPEMIALKCELLPERPRLRYVAESALSTGWMEDLGWEAGQPLLFVAEGFLMYCTPGEVRGLLEELSRRFMGAEFLAEVVSPLAVRLSRWQPTLRKAGVRARWGIADARHIEEIVPGVRFVREWSYDRHPRRWGWRFGLRVLGPVRRLMRIVLLELRPR